MKNSIDDLLKEKFSPHDLAVMKAQGEELAAKRMEIHDRMRRARVTANLTQSEVGERVALMVKREEPISSQAVAGWEKGQLPTLENFYAWCRVVGADADTILFGSDSLHGVRFKNSGAYGEPQTFMLVPRYDIKAGTGEGEEFRREDFGGFLAFDSRWLDKHEIYDTGACIYAKGDSMSPTIRDGDICLINVKIRDGDGVFAIRRPVGPDASSIVLKRFEYRLNGELWIFSDNEKVVHSPEVVKDPVELEQIEVIGKVVWSGGTIT